VARFEEVEIAFVPLAEREEDFEAGLGRGPRVERAVAEGAGDAECKFLEGQRRFRLCLGSQCDSICEMNETAWFYERSGERVGPVSLDALRLLRSEGALGDETLVWCEGMPDWRPFAEAVPGVLGETAPREGATAPSSAPTPVPALASADIPPVPKLAEPVREVSLDPGFQPRLRATFGRAWRRFIQRLWPFVGCYALTAILIGAASQFILPIFFLALPLYGGLSWYYLQHLRQRPVTLEAIFFGFKRRFGDLAILNLVFSLPLLFLFMVGVALFFAAVVVFASTAQGHGESEWSAGEGILVGVGALVAVLTIVVYCGVGILLSFASIAILDGDLSWRVALSKSWSAVRPHLGKLVLIYFAAMSLSSVGALALYVGVFFTGAWGHLVLVLLYEDAFGESAGSASAE